MSLDLDRDGISEEIVLAGYGGSPQRLGFDYLEPLVIEEDRLGYEVTWQSGHERG